MKKWAELVVNLGLCFWTKKRVLFTLAAYTLDRLFLVSAFPVALLPALATLALFDYKAGKFPKLKGKPARQKLVLMALSCTLPLIALHLIELVTSGLNSLWNILWDSILSVAQIVGNLPHVPSPSFLAFALSFIVRNLLTAFIDLLSEVIQPLTWICVFWVCLPIAATERKVDRAMIRAYLYGFALLLIPALIEGVIVGLVHEWELRQPPSQPIPLWALKTITSFVDLGVWGAVAFLLLRLLPRLRFLQDESN
ncbi:hypothetical protein Q2T83_13840 [Fervidibacter sacchari]|uniref:Uncharacterized protein n=1 Tax=Candidatus Fervidibacter sacchari TaxID=1448929 RepID=A0ABT2ENZ3_9BACT|nr:hypothetical protein [Candidatus Fervidibacter sacchari]MCS3919688.1 hypothetical protein [Candidatus Fervidibacter sacchari]WKU15404.1 hypothetical protein Q2T83_13840 [Candidatus Fervidibacter sacchari]